MTNNIVIGVSIDENFEHNKQIFEEQKKLKLQSEKIFKVINEVESEGYRVDFIDKNETLKKKEKERIDSTIRTSLISSITTALTIMLLMLLLKLL